MTSLERAPGARLVLDRTRTITDSNDRCRVVFERDITDLHGATLAAFHEQDLLDEGSYRTWRAAVEAVREGTPEVTERITLTPTGADEALPYRLTVTAADGDDGIRCSLESVPTAQRYGETVRALHAATRDLMTADSREAVLERTAEAANEVLGFPGTGVRVYDPDAEVLRSVSLGGRVAEIDSRPPYPVDDSPHGEAFQRGETVVDDIGPADPYDRVVFAQTMYVPIGDVALLSLGTVAREFDSPDVQFAEMLAENAAAALRVVETTATLRQERKHLDLLKQILTRVLRHNIRNHASVIRGNAEVLADDPNPDLEAAGRILECTEDILEMSEKARDIEEIVDSGQSRRAIDLDDAVDRAVERTRGAYPDAVIETDVEACPVRAHEALSVAVENLIENACEHATRTPTVGVTTTVQKESVRLSVTDDGPGIPEGELEVLDVEAETDLSHGSGLGLWTVKLVVEMSRGSVDFETGPEGTRVTLVLPRAAE